MAKGKDGKEKPAMARQIKVKADDVSHLSDEIQDLLRKEKRLLGEMAEVKGTLNSEMDKKEAAMNKYREENKEVLEKYDEEFSELQAKNRQARQKVQYDEKEAAYLESDMAAASLSVALNNYQTARSKKDVAQMQLSMQMQQVGKLEREIKDLTKAQAGKTSDYKTLKELDDAIASFTNKEQKAKDKGQAVLAKDWGQKRNQLMKIRPVQQAADRQHFAEKELTQLLDKCDELKATLDEAEDEMNGADKLVKEAKKAKKDADEHARTVRDEYKKQLKVMKEVKKDLDTVAQGLRDKRREETKSRMAYDTTALDEAKKKKTAIQRELASIEKKIPTRVIDVDMDCIGALLAQDGANLSALQVDCEVHISIRYREGKVAIRGEGKFFDECEAGIKALLAEAKANRKELTLEFDEKLRPTLLRQLARMEKTSNCRINVDKRDAKMTIVGSEEGIACGKELYEEFLVNSFREDIPVKPVLVDALDRRTARLYEIQTTTGAGTVRLLKREKVVQVQGKKDCVEPAAAAVKEMVGRLMDGYTTLALPAGVPMGPIFGAKAANLTAIEERTGVYVHVETKEDDEGEVSNTFHLFGNKEQVAEGKSVLRSLFAEFKRDELKVNYPVAIHNMLLRVPKAKVEEVAKKVKVKNATKEGAEGAEEKEGGEPKAAETEEDAVGAEDDKKDEEEETKAAESKVEEDKEDEPEAEAEAEAEAGAAEDEDADAKAAAAAERKQERRAAERERKKQKKQEEKQRKQESLPYVERVRVESGCEKVKIMRDLGYILVVGKPAAAAKAKAMLEAFIEEKKVGRVKLACAPVLCLFSAVKVGKEPSLASKLRGMEDMDDAYFNSEEGVVELNGSKACVDAAKAMLAEYVKAYTPNVVSTVVPRGRAAAVVGAKGAMIQKIQKATESSVLVDRQAMKAVVVAPTKSQSEKALDMIETAIKEDIERISDEELAKKGGEKGGKGGKGYGDRKGGKGEKGGKGDKGGKGGKGGSKGGKKRDRD